MEDKKQPGPRPAMPRWVMISVIAVNFTVNFTDYFVADFPQALEQALIRLLHIDTIDIGLLYSVSFMPNLICSPLMGYFIEIAGLQISMMVFTVVLYFGQLLITIGIFRQEFWWIVIGRGIYGIGGEGICILQPTLNEYWFSGRMLSISNGLSETSDFAALMLGNYFVPKIFLSTRSIRQVFVFMNLLAGANILICIWYYYLHQTCNQYATAGIEDDVSSDEELETNTKQPGTPMTPLSSLTRENLNPQDLRFEFSSIPQLSITFWLLGLSYLLLADCFYQFTNLATDLLMNRFSYAYSDTKNLTILPTLTILCTNTWLAAYFQTHGRKAKGLLGASCLFLFTYIFMSLLPAKESYLVGLCLILIGLAFSIMLSTIFSCVALSVPHEATSIAYSLFSVVENLGLTFLPFLFSYICKKRTPGAYSNAIVGLIILSAIAVGLQIFLIFVDNRNGLLLDLPENSRTVAKLRHKIQKKYVEYCMEKAMKKMGRIDEFELKEVAVDKKKA